MAYTFDTIFAADPNNPSVVASNAAITIFDPADAGKAPIAITDPTGVPLSNPVTVNKNGLGSSFVADIDRVGWHGAGFIGYLTSYEGMKAEAVAARAAADAVKATADAGGFKGAKGDKGDKGDQGLPGVNAVENDTAVAAYVNNPASSTRGALDGKYDPLLVNSQKTVRNRDLFVDAVAEGAPTDGVTDAQPKIGASHNLLPTAGGRVVLRKGSYLMSTRLIVTRQGMVLEGDGIGATTLLLNAAGFQVGASDVLIRNMTIKGNGSNARSLFQLVTTGAFKNWRFENVKFDGVAVVPSRLGATDSTGATLTSAAGLDSFVEFERCEFTNYTEDGSLHVRGTHHVTIDRSWFHDAGTDTTKGDLLKLSAGAEHWKVLHSRFTDGKRDAIDAYDAHRGLIDGNTIVNMGVHGIELKVASATAPNPADRTTVVNNHVVNVGTATASPAVQLAVSNVIATGNRIEGGTSYGMRCGKSTDNVTNSRDIIWANNHVKGTTSHGFMLNGVDGAIIQGNAAINCGGSGFSIPLGTTNSLIVGGAANNLSRGNTAADVWT